MFVVCGEALIDIFVDYNNQSKAEQFSMQACVGGSSFNVAIGLARLNQSVSLLGGLSDDMFGKRLLKVLESEGVSKDLIVTKSLPTTVAFIEKDSEGVPSYLFLGEGAADRSLEKSDLNLNIDMPLGIHLGSFSIVAQPTSDSLLALVKHFSGKCLISLDPNVRAVVEPDMTVWKNRVDELVKLADIVKISDEDLGLMYPGVEPEQIIETWLDTGLNMVVLTRGGEGSSLWSKKGRVDIQSPKVEVIDTVGAGDTYQAAILDSVGELIKQYPQNWEEELSPEKLTELGSYAAKAAAITCSRQGADLPTKADISQF